MQVEANKQIKKIAIITGASSGMGMDFAKELDEKKLDEIWIIARRKDRLEALAQALKTPTRIFAIDLTKTEELQQLEDALKTKAYGIQYLINNAGFGLAGAFTELDKEKQLNMIDLNVRSLVDITYFCIPFMNAGSEILQVASTAGFLPIKNFAIYAATKAFVVNFSNALTLELKAKKIHVTAVCPGPVKTEFFNVATEGKEPILLYNSPDVVKKALKDSKRKKMNSIYGFIMNLAMFFSHFSPRKLKATLAAKGF